MGVDGYEDMSYEAAGANHLVIHDSGVSADLPQLPDPAALAAAELQVLWSSHVLFYLWLCTPGEVKSDHKIDLFHLYGSVLVPFLV